MKSENHPKRGRSPSKEIDAMIKAQRNWRGDTLSQLREIITKADQAIIEEVKWKKPSNPAGVPVWSSNGIVCIGNLLKMAVRLTFPWGSQLRDPKKLFNARLDSKTVRAIDVCEGERVDEAALRALILDAIEVNASRERE